MKVIYTDEIMGDQPFRFGQFDAEHGEPCDPEGGFTSNDCIVHYTLGFISVAGESEETNRLLETYDSPDIAKNWVELEWEMRFKNSRSGKWIPCTEERVKTALLMAGLKIEEEMEVMRQESGKVTCFTPIADFRHIAQEIAREF